MWSKALGPMNAEDRVRIALLKFLPINYLVIGWRAEDFFLPGAVTFFLTAPGKFLTAPPLFALYLVR